MARTKRGDARLIAIWEAAKEMLAPELARYQTRYPRSRRCALLEALAIAMQHEDHAALADAGLRYLRLTRLVPPGCYAVGGGRHYLAGERVQRRRGEVWTVHVYSPQVWR